MVRTLSLLLFAPLLLISQAFNYSSWNVQLLSRINPDTSLNTTPVGNRYSGCWGWYQSNKNREYVISGAANGTYFIDITNPQNPVVCDFVGGKKGCTWREIKTYQNYCYVASDDAKPNTFQIIDMQYLPDSVQLIHNSNSIFERGHTLWIDQNKLYVGMTTFSTGSSPMSIFSLATPSAPVLL
jgi:choice-of-anchor B domain-containing protein